MTGSYRAQTYGGRLETGYRYAGPLPIGVTPYAAVQLQYVHTPAYAETDISGGAMAFSYNASDGTDTRSELGVRFDTDQIVSMGTIVWSARAAWAHDWLSNFGVVSTFEAVPTVSFTANGAALLPKDSALLTLRGDLRLISAWTVGAKFSGQFADGYDTYAGMATLRHAW